MRRLQTGRLASLIARWIASTLFALLGAAASAGTTKSSPFPQQPYEGSQQRRVKVYVPAALNVAAPMVMALHGCRQTNADVLADWGLKAAADRFGFILVAPFITTWDGQRTENCWGYWLDGHRHAGRGEPEDLHQIALEVERRHAIDPRQRFVVGLSSGGAMSVVAAVAHNEYWAAAATAAGLPYGEGSMSASSPFIPCPGFALFRSVDGVVADMRAERNDGYVIPLMVLQNDRDCSVLKEASRNLRDAHLKVFGDAAHDTPAEARAVQQACSPVFGGNDFGCEHIRYTVDGQAGSRSLVETVFFSGPIVTPHPGDNDRGHYWIGGERGRDGRWSVRRGPSFPDIVWSFFASHARTRQAQGDGPRITLRGDHPMRQRPPSRGQ